MGKALPETGPGPLSQVSATAFELLFASFSPLSLIARLQGVVNAHVVAYTSKLLLDSLNQSHAIQEVKEKNFQLYTWLCELSMGAIY